MSAGLVEEGGIARVVLARPRANILDSAMIGAIRGHLASLRGRADLRLLVFTAEGPEFSFGASVEEHRPERVRDMFAEFHAMFREIEALGVPTAAVVRGRCLGGALELAAWCGRLFAAPDAVFALPEVRLGVFPPMGTLALGWRCAGPAVIDAVVGGADMDAATALSCGIADEVTEDPEGALLAWYRARIAPHSAVAVRFAWRASRMPLADRLAEDLPRLEALYLDELMATADAVEGIASFCERRAPRYVNR